MMLHPMRLTRGMQRFLIKIRMPQTVDKKLFSPQRERIALSANERIAEFLDFAIQAKFSYVNKLRHTRECRYHNIVMGILPRHAVCKRELFAAANAKWAKNA